MIPIKKKASPAILLEKQRIARERGLNSNDAYEQLNHEDKTAILKSLMEEQGHLCAYCTRRIPDERELPDDIDPVTIEHWFPRNPPTHEEKGQGLDYKNMLAVCSGNRGRKHTRKPRDLTCDAKRRDTYPQLTLNPCDPATLASIQYRENGEMFSNDPAVQDDITVKLNLNCISEAVQLPESRRKVLEAMQSELPMDDEEETKEYCISVLEMFEQETDPKSEYSGSLIWWLKDYIGRH